MLSSIARPMRRLACPLFTQMRMASDERSEWYGFVTRMKMDPIKEVGHWPRNKEERERAARKYNLIPEDYEPYEEGLGFGDYPKLEEVGAFNKDPYDDYDDYGLNRFYGEPLTLHNDLYQWERIDPKAHEKRNIGYLGSFLIFISVPTTVALILYICKEYRLYMNPPYKSRKFLISSGQPIYEFPSSGNSEHH